MDQRACPERAGPFCVLKATVCQTESTAWQQSALGRHNGAMAKGGRETATHALVAGSLGLRLWDADFCVLKEPSARPKAQPGNKAPWGGARALWQRGGAKLQRTLHGEFILARAGTLEFGTQPSGPSEFGTQTSGPSEFGTQTSGPSEFGTQTLGPSEFGTQTSGPSKFGTQTSGPSEFGTTAANTRRHKRRSTLRPQYEA